MRTIFYIINGCFIKYFKFITIIAIVFSIILINIHLHRNIKNFNYIQLDKRQEPNKSQIFQHISKEIPYLPIEDLTNIDYRNRNFNHSCAWYPTLSDIQIHNDYWQELKIKNISYYIFGAYLDNRPSVVKDEPVIRILTMIHFLSPNNTDYAQTYCQFWYEEQPQPIIVLATGLDRLWYWGWDHDARHNYGHFILCALPKEHKDWIPRTVSLVSKPCDKATNNVKVTYLPLKNNEIKKGFAVCVKGLDFPYVDLSHRLVEYIETLRLLGADKITMYKLQVHANTTKVIEYYQRSGFLEYRPFSFSLEVGSSPEYLHMELQENANPHVKNEVIPYNDCLYRNMYHYDYVTNVDIDEVLMPLSNFSNWYDLLQFGESVTNDYCKKFTSFCLRCIYFPRYPNKPRYSNEIPEYLYMLQHVERVRDHIRPDWATKCFHHTDRAIATHNHFPMHWTSDSCQAYSFNATDAQMNHYREPPVMETLNDPVIDKSLWRLKDEIIKRSMKVFEELEFF